MIQNFGEHGLLSLLDGEHQVSNVVVLATTNYPELLANVLSIDQAVLMKLF